MRKLPLILTMIIAISCTSQRQDSLSNDSAVKMVFDSSEINDLLKIQDLFDKSIGLTDKNKNEDLLKVYTDFLTQILKLKRLPILNCL